MATAFFTSLQSGFFFEVISIFGIMRNGCSVSLNYWLSKHTAYRFQFSNCKNTHFSECIIGWRNTIRSLYSFIILDGLCFKAETYAPQSAQAICQISEQD